MWLLPYNKATLQTHLSKDEVKRRLQVLRHSERRRPQFFVWFLGMPAQYQAFTRHNSFLLQRFDINYRSNYPRAYSIIIKGIIETNGPLTTLKLKAKTNPAYLYILLVILILMLVLGVVSWFVKWLLFNRPFTLSEFELGLPVLFVLFPYIVFTISYKANYFFTLRFLKKLLEAESVK